jgi:hypothetical protein
VPRGSLKDIGVCTSAWVDPQRADRAPEQRE